MSRETTPLVLVIDDDRGICQSIAMHLRFRGWRVDTAANGFEGLRRLREGDVDLVLCDIGLPDLSGHEVFDAAVHEAEEGHWSVPEFVIMTANATLDHAVTALKQGACQFVTKPISLPFLEVVVDRAMALRELHHQVAHLQAEQTELIMKSLGDLTGQLGLVGALEAVLRAAVTLLTPSHAAIWLADQDHGELRPVTVRLPDGDEPLSAEHQVLARECFGAALPLVKHHGERLYTAAPILIDERIEGLISVEFEAAEDAPEQNDRRRELVTNMAVFAANAIRKERLFTHLEQSSMKISSLFEVGLAMSSEVSLQRLFDVIVDSAARICGAERCSLMVIDKDRETMRMRAAIGIPADVVAKAEGRVGQGIAGTVAANGEPLFIANIEQDGAFSKKNSSDRYNNTSLVCVPIRVHDQVVGVINVNNKTDSGSFTENDLNLLTLLASQAAVALDNANRYQDLSEKAITDGLTGIYIRRYFDECLERAYRNAKTTGRSFTLLMVDIDRFKAVNDTYGHTTGDQALRTVAGILRQVVRDDDLLARYGGEEFAIILSRAGEPVARRVAERVRSMVEQTPVETDAHTLAITVSVGVCTFQEQQDSPEAIINGADTALYRAKETGRNRVVMASDLPA